MASTSETQSVSQIVDEMIQMVGDQALNRAVNHEQDLDEEYKWMKKAREEAESAILVLERVAFTIANLSVGLQGVCVAAILNNASSICSMWYACILVLFTSLPNLVTLFVIGLRYKILLEFHGGLLRDCQRLEWELIELFPDRYASLFRNPWRVHNSNMSMWTPLIGKRGTLWMAIVYATYSILIAFSPMVVICKHLEGIKK